MLSKKPPLSAGSYRIARFCQPFHSDATKKEGRDCSRPYHCELRGSSPRYSESRGLKPALQVVYGPDARHHVRHVNDRRARSSASRSR